MAQLILLLSVGHIDCIAYSIMHALYTGAYKITFGTQLEPCFRGAKEPISKPSGMR